MIYIASFWLAKATQREPVLRRREREEKGTYYPSGIFNMLGNKSLANKNIIDAASVSTRQGTNNQ